METSQPNPETSRPGDGDVWDHARREYLAGVTARTICQRYGMSLASFRAHARAGGWRRMDRADCDIAPEPGEYHPDDDVSFSTLADQAFLNIRRAIGAGRAAEAASWMRLFDKLADRARAEVLSDLPDYPAADPVPGPRDPLFLTAKAASEIPPDSSALEQVPETAHENLDSLDPVFSESSPPATPAPAPDPTQAPAAIAADPLAAVRRAALLLLRSRRLAHDLGTADVDAQLDALGPGP